MKQIVFTAGLAAVLLFPSCKADRGKMIVNTWKMAEDSSMVFTLDADSSFTFREDQVAVTGKWSLSSDGRWLHLKNDKKEKDNLKRNLEIKELTHEHMVLSDNGDSMVFVGSK